MSLSVEQITEEALSLPDDARALLANRLFQSLESLEDDRIKALWFEEIDRRLAAVDSGKVKPIPRLEAFARVRKAVAR